MKKRHGPLLTPRGRAVVLFCVACLAAAAIWGVRAGLRQADRSAETASRLFIETITEE